MFKFKKLTFAVSEEAKSLVSDLLLGLDAISVAEDVVEGEQTTEVSALFPRDVDLTAVIDSLKNYKNFLETYMPGIIIGDIMVEEIDRSSWQVWKQVLKTVRATDRVVIRPPWEEYARRDGEVVIEINPSMAFGTGHHETTRLCIRAIEEMVQRRRIGRLLDVGCGSGILSISAVKLGVDEAIAVDNDPVAVKEARENLERNGVSSRVRLFCGYIEGIRSEFDLIVANITAEVIYLIREELMSRLQAGGKLIASGIPTPRRDEVKRGLEGVGFKLDKELTDGEWLAFLFDVDKNHS